MFQDSFAKISRENKNICKKTNKMANRQFKGQDRSTE